MLDERKEIRLGDEVNLVYDQDHLLIQALEPLENIGLTVDLPHPGFDHQQNQVGLLDRRPRSPDHQVL